MTRSKSSNTPWVIYSLESDTEARLSYSFLCLFNNGNLKILYRVLFIYFGHSPEIYLMVSRLLSSPAGNRISEGYRI